MFNFPLTKRLWPQTQLSTRFVMFYNKDTQTQAFTQAGKKQWHRYRNVEQSFPINRTTSGGAGQDKVEKVGFNDMAWWHRWIGQKCKNYFSLMFYVLASVLCCSQWGDDRRPWWGGQLCRVLDSGTQGGQSSNLDDEHSAFEVFLFAFLEWLISLSCTEGLRLQPSKDGEREVNHDETATLDRS